MHDPDGRSGSGWSLGGRYGRQCGPGGPPRGPIRPRSGAGRLARLARPVLLFVFVLLCALGLFPFGLFFVALVTGTAAWAWILVGLAVLAASVLVWGMVRIFARSG